MDLHIDPELAAVAPGIQLGVLVLDGVSAGPAPAELTSALAQAAASAARLGSEVVAQLPAVAGWRRVLRSLGTDPTRYRPSGEALLRRAVGGKGLPEVNAMVDTGNLVSLESGLPIGLYDLDRVRPPLRFGAGRAGEVYAALSGRELETEGKPVLRDAAGVCGGPLTDSARTSVTGATRRVLLVAYGPPGLPAGALDRALARAAELAARHAGATVVQQLVMT